MKATSTVSESQLKPSTIPPHLTSLVIQPSRGWASLGLRDVWEYRELLVYLVFREIQGAYRQTALGMTWMFLRPLLNMIILSFVFGRMVKVPTDGIPYPLFSLAALLPWGFFSNAVLRASRSLVDNMHVISKVYFPRMIIPIAGASSGLLDFAASFVVLVIAMLFYRTPLRVEMLWIPVFLAVTLVFSLAVGLWLATLSAKYRDVSFAVTFLLQAMMYASPVIYPISLVPDRLKFIYQLNPMTGVIEGFRWALFGTGQAPNLAFLVSIGLLLVGLIGGAYIFRRTERTVVDVI